MLKALKRKFRPAGPKTPQVNPTIFYRDALLPKPPLFFSASAGIAETADQAIRADDAMAGRIQIAIAVENIADIAPSPRLADSSGDISVSGHLSFRNASCRGVDFCG